jgi:hypothetical protein
VVRHAVPHAGGRHRLRLPRLRGRPRAPGYVTFWQGGFTGPTLEYAPSQVGTSCVTLPVSVQSDLNYSYRTVQVYDGTGCTGSTLTLPPGDLHGFGGFAAKSFRFTT